MDIFGIGMLEILVVLVVALVVLGPGRTLDMARGAGKMLGEVRRAMTDLSKVMEEEERELKRETQKLEEVNPEHESPPEERQ